MWIEPLKQAIQKAKHKAGNIPPRVAVLGIGNDLNGDDAAGVLVARSLLAALAQQNHLLVYDCGEVPENYFGKLLNFSPHLVILIDAADFHGFAGETTWLLPEAITGKMGTHGLSLGDFAQILQREFDCEIGVIGIQPESIRFSDPPTQTVCAAAEQVSQRLKDLLEIR